jgi:endo-1,4-beta-xylanase
MTTPSSEPLRTIAILMLLAFVIDSCTAATPTATPRSSATSAPPTATLTSTPAIPTIDVDGLQVPDPKAINPELFDVKNPDSPIVQFANAFGVEPEDVGELRPALKTSIDGKPFVILTTSDLSSTANFDESGIPLLIATGDRPETLQWKSATLENTAHQMGLRFSAQLNLNQDFRAITLENFGGGFGYIDWNLVEAEKGNYDFSDPDYNINTAYESGLLVRANLLWGHGNVASWVRLDPVLHDVMIDYLTTVMNHYKGKVKTWDVFNEVNRKGDDVFWNKLGMQGVRDAYATARAIDPHATLLYNDFVDLDGTESGNRLPIIESVVSRIKQDGNLDGIALQIYINRMDTFDPDKLRNALAALKQYGLPIYISEFLVVIHGDNTPVNLQQQAKTGAEIIQILRDSGAIVEVTAFGLEDRLTKKLFQDNTVNAGFWLKMDSGFYVPKPIVFAMMKAVISNP